MTDQLDALIESPPNATDRDACVAWREQCRVVIRIIFGEGSTELERFDGVRFTPMTHAGDPTATRRVGVRDTIAMLAAAKLHLVLVEPTEPELDPRGMHAWVSGPATPLWEGEHHRQAVQEAARAVEMQLRLKLGQDGDGTLTDMCSTAFSTSDPSEGKPRLRFSAYPPGSDAWRNAHDGAGAFGRGCGQRLRNLLSHNDDISAQEAIEALGAFSLLARWIDEAEVEQAADG